MQRLELKARHKPVQNYYAGLRQFDDLGVTHETAVRSAFQGLLDHCACQHDWTLVPNGQAPAPAWRQARQCGPSETSENTCPAPTPAQNPQQMNAPQKQSSPSRAASENQPANAQPEQGQPATLVQKIFIAGLYLYVLSLVWLTLSHHWYGVLPKWLDPH